MPVHRIGLVLVMAALALNSLPASAYSCSCAPPPPPAQALEDADAVFRGVVTKGELVKSDRGWGSRTFTFRVEEVWKGDLGGHIVVRTGLGGGDCGYNFVVGRPYLVYAAYAKGTDQVHTSICRRTGPLWGPQRVGAETEELGTGWSPAERETGSPVTQVRRVVTGQSKNGKSIFLSDGAPTQALVFEHIPGFEIIDLWATEDIPHLSMDGEVPTGPSSPSKPSPSFLPSPGGTRFRIIRIPPASTTLEVDVEAAAREYSEKVPDLAAAHDSDNPDMHTTDTVDYIVILSGEIWLELDDGAEVHLRSGDVVIQNGTRHAWHNRGAEACVFAGVMVGAER